LSTRCRKVEAFRPPLHFAPVSTVCPLGAWLTLKLVRRMKHTYPRAIRLVETGMINLDDLISHHVPLDEVAAAFASNVAYEQGILKIVVNV